MHGFNLAAAHGEADAIRERDAVALHMSDDQIGKAQAVASEMALRFP